MLYSFKYCFLNIKFKINIYSRVKYMECIWIGFFCVFLLFFSIFLVRLFVIFRCGICVGLGKNFYFIVISNVI